MSLARYENSGSLCDILANVVKHTCVCAKEVRHMQNCQTDDIMPLQYFCCLESKPIVHTPHSLHNKGQTHFFFGADTPFFNVSVFHSSVLKVVCFPWCFMCVQVNYRDVQMGFAGFISPFIKNSCQQMSNLFCC